MYRLVLVLLLLASVSGLHAQDDDAISSATVSLASRRVFRGVMESGAGGEGTVQFSRNGWRIGANIWQPFNRDEPGQGSLTTNYAWAAAKSLKLAVGATQYGRLDALPGATKHSLEVGMSATWTLPSGLAMEVSGLRDIRLQSNTVQFTLNYSMPLKSLGAYLEWSASIGSSTAHNLRPDAAGPAIRDGYSYYIASVRLPYRIGSQTTLVTGAHIAESDGQSLSWSPIRAQGGFKGWVDLGLSFDF